MINQVKKPLLFVLVLALFLAPLQSVIARAGSTGVAQDACGRAYDQADSSVDHVSVAGSDQCVNDSQCTNGVCPQSHCVPQAFSAVMDLPASHAMAASEITSHSNLDLPDSLHFSLYRPPRA
ncbi:MAG: hypothetical protein BMS9Abin26_1500 [Gammaproteobacteria bacterium]|nr:MAG: hypothetical protein BMS9Abin26_1500 [Gammaproteobacteria bacterium]